MSSIIEGGCVIDPTEMINLLEKRLFMLAYLVFFIICAYLIDRGLKMFGKIPARTIIAVVLAYMIATIVYKLTISRAF